MVLYECYKISIYRDRVETKRSDTIELWTNHVITG